MSNEMRAVEKFFAYTNRRIYGLDHDHWKPMKTGGAGVREIRVNDAGGAFRAIYIATLADAVYVLHAFQKKTQAIGGRDLELATKRYEELVRRIR